MINLEALDGGEIESIRTTSTLVGDLSRKFPSNKSIQPCLSEEQAWWHPLEGNQANEVCLKPQKLAENFV